MPFWRTPYYTRWRRWRRTRRRRPRRAFWRAFRGRRQTVRRRRIKKKLKTLSIRQFQPPTIRLLKITGKYQLFFCTSDRIPNNNTLYLDTISPFHIPSGGGFSLTQFTLQNLFDQHIRLRNWWTKSNEFLPLVRYIKCIVYLYYQENVDYIFAYDTSFPLKASRLMYNSTQPSVMYLMKHRKVVPCKHYNKRRKPYKRLVIKPPAQLENKWYFQHNLADIPLVNFMAVACSLDRWYTSSKASTPTIGFTCLDAQVWQMHNFKEQTTYGYQPQPNQHLFSMANGNLTLQTIKIGDLILLANACDHQTGIELKNVSGTGETRWNNWVSKKENWGNPFLLDYLDGTKPLIKSTTPLTTIRDKLKTYAWDMTKHLSDFDGMFQISTVPNLIHCRYNPNNDKGIGNKVYFLPITNEARQGWDPQPNKPELLYQDLPLWALYWGLVDWNKRANTITSIETHGITVFQTQYINPKEEKYYVPLGKYFLSDRSQYYPPGDPSEPQIAVGDLKNWHPKLSFQLDVITDICNCGPGTVKLPPDISCEAYMKYKFVFKIGGSPPPMEIVSDPSKQPIWPLPSNFTDTTSLQSPGIPFEHFLYHFDQRGDYLTKAAIQRLQKDFPSKEIIPSITGTTGLNIPTPQTQESDSEEEIPQEIQTTLQQQLLLQRREQHKLRQRINQLLTKISLLE
nr:MAG: ORF1 [TTV-like mini virus]